MPFGAISPDTAESSLIYFSSPLSVPFLETEFKCGRHFSRSVLVIYIKSNDNSLHREMMVHYSAVHSVYGVSLETTHHFSL